MSTPTTGTATPPTEDTMSEHTAEQRTSHGPGVHRMAVAGPVDLTAEAGSGTLVVRVGDPGTCTVEVTTVDGRARSLEHADGVTVRQVGDRVEVRVPKSMVVLGRDPRVDVTVTVPPGSAADLSTRSGAVRTDAGLARLVAASGSGDVHAGAVSGHVRVSTGSGDVDVAGVGASVVAKSGSGRVRLGPVGEALHASTGSGDVLVDAVDGDAEVSTGSGDVRIDRSVSGVRVSTASGDVGLGAAVSGDVTVKTASGDVLVVVPDGTDVLLDCSTVSGRLRSGLAPSDGPTEGRAVLRLTARTVSGDLEVRRA